MLKRGAAYHQVGYQTYLQWLVEQGLKSEARYYGWVVTPKRYREQDLEARARREKLTRQKIRRLIDRAEKKAKARETPKPDPELDSIPFEDPSNE